MPKSSPSFSMDPIPRCFYCLRDLSSDDSDIFCLFCKLPGHRRTCSKKVTAARTACSSRANPVSDKFPSPWSHLDPTIVSIIESSESSRKTFDSKPIIFKNFPTVFNRNSCAFCWETGHAHTCCPTIAPLRRKPVSSGCFTSNTIEVTAIHTTKSASSAVNSELFDPTIKFIDHPTQHFIVRNLELALEPSFSDDLNFEEILSSKFDSTYPTSSFTDRDAAGISDDSTIFPGSTSTSTQPTDFAPGSGPLFNPGEKTPGQIFVDPHGHRSSIIRSSPPALSEQSRITVPNLALISSSVEPETFPLDCYSDNSLDESYSLRSGIPAAFFWSSSY